MKAEIFSNELLIGTSDLELSDESMGCVYGEFSPTQNYFDKVQQYVFRFWETNNPNF